LYFGDSFVVIAGAREDEVMQWMEGYKFEHGGSYGPEVCIPG